MKSDSGLIGYWTYKRVSPASYDIFQGSVYVANIRTGEYVVKQICQEHNAVCGLDESMAMRDDA